MDHLLGDAKRLVQRLTNHDNSVDSLISEATNLQNKLIAMRQYKDEVAKLNDIADHRPRSTLILGSQLENQRIQGLEQENRELSISLAEHQSALELIMNKYREQVLLMMEHKPLNVDVSKNKDETIEMVYMKERIAEMAHVMLKSAAIDDNAQIQEIEFIRRLQVENENLRELLEISGGKLPYDSDSCLDRLCSVSPNMNPDHILPLETCVLPKTESKIENEPATSIKTESEPTPVGNNVDSFPIQGSSDEELFNSLPMKKRYGAKKGRMPLPFDIVEAEDSCTNTVIKNKEHIQKLEQLFKDPSRVLNDSTALGQSLSSDMASSSSNSNPDNYFLSMDPSENCFRAIISDIKPLDFNIDMNEKLNDKLFDLENVTSHQQSDKTNKPNKTDPFFTDIANDEPVHDDELTDLSESSVLDFLDSVIDDPSEDYETSETSNIFTIKTQNDSCNRDGESRTEVSGKSKSDTLFPANSEITQEGEVVLNENSSNDCKANESLAPNEEISITLQNKLHDFLAEYDKKNITSLESQADESSLSNDEGNVTVIEKEKEDFNQESTSLGSDIIMHEDEGGCLVTPNDKILTNRDNLSDLVTDDHQTSSVSESQETCIMETQQKTFTTYSTHPSNDKLLLNDHQQSDELGDSVNDVPATHNAHNAHTATHNEQLKEVGVDSLPAPDKPDIVDDASDEDELDVLDFLDDMLELESNLDEYTETVIDNDTTTSESVIHNDTINESATNNHTNNENIIDDYNHSNHNFNEKTTLNSSSSNIDENTSCVSNNPISADNNKIDIKLNVENIDGNLTKLKLTELPSSDRRTPVTPYNGDISDDDSETTYTEDDVDQTLSEFDSIFDSNDYDDDDDFE